MINLRSLEVNYLHFISTLSVLSVSIINVKMCMNRVIMLILPQKQKMLQKPGPYVQ